jgi:hypothetical protein
MAAPMKVVAAAAIIVAGQLLGPAPARAIPPVPLDPPCLDWSYTGTFTIVQSDGNSVRIANWSGASAPSDPSAAALYLADGTQAMIDGNGYRRSTTRALLTVSIRRARPAVDFKAIT